MNIIRSGMRLSLVGLALLLSVSFSYAHGEKKQHDMTPPDSLAVSVAVDSKGKLWRVGVSDGFVQVAHSANLGKTFTTPVRANTVKQNITAHGEIRPKIAVGKNGEIYVTWMQNLKARFSGYIWFARSVNGGKSFEKPFVVHQDRAEISHAFEELLVAPDGKITVLWLDARDAEADNKSGKKRSGSSIYYAISTDAGKTFALEQRLADNSCECCRIATASKPDGTVVALWRHVFEGSERDHMIAEIPSTVPALEANNHAVPRRATFGRWVIDGCPHHGAAIASGGEGKSWWGYHMAYFDGQDAKTGLYYSRMDGVAWASSPAKKFGDNAKQAGHPAILSNGENVWLVWREIKDSKSSILGMFSDDGGKNWNDAKTLANVSEKADYPILIQHKTQPYLVWNTQQKGLQVIELSK
ncbi:MAG: sialidase family protein [Methylotenera sp.]